MDDTPLVLIVDSNAGFAKMLEESLEQDGEFQATIVHTGAQALEIASQESFNLAIVDLGIPAVDDLDGEAVARRLREEQSDLRLILIPLAGDVLPEGLGDLDVQGVLPKPFFLPDLPGLLDTAMTQPVRESKELIGASEPKEEKAQAVVDAALQDAPRTWSPQVVQELENLAREVNADAVLMTRAGRILESVGRLDEDQLSALAHIVWQSSQLSNQVAEALGRGQKHYEQSVEGDEHALYTLTIVGDVLLSVILGPDVTLGLLRHQTKRAAKRLYALAPGS
jgi:DNA-binding response OmpR family regulator